MAITPVSAAGTGSASGGQQTSLKTLQKQEEQLRQQIQAMQKTNPDSPQIKVLQQRLSQIETQILEAENQQTQSAVSTSGGKSASPPVGTPGAVPAAGGKVDITT